MQARVGHLLRQVSDSSARLLANTVRYKPEQEAGTSIAAFESATSGPQLSQHQNDETPSTSSMAHFSLQFGGFTDGRSIRKQPRHAAIKCCNSCQTGCFHIRHLSAVSSTAKAKADKDAPVEVTLEQQERECWSCAHKFSKGGLICRGCEKIQPVDTSLNYFELFGMPEMKFDLDVAKLEQKYKRLQWQLHPDKTVSRPSDEQDFSAQQATIVNMAYSVLKSPLSRANYMLAQRGINTGEDHEGTIADPELLMEVMEAREEVEETDDARRLGEMLQRNRQQQAELVRKLGAAFASSTGTADAVALTMQLTYLARLEEEISKKLPTA